MASDCCCTAAPRRACSPPNAVAGATSRLADASPVAGPSPRRAAASAKPGALWRLGRLALAVAPGAALALLPKCPLCLIASLSALGIGASAVPLAGAVYPLAGVAAVAAACALVVWLVRRARCSRRIVPLLAVSLAITATAIVLLGGAAGTLRLAALAALTLLLVWAERATRASRRAHPAGWIAG